jgi:tRNA modification GTPase
VEHQPPHRSRDGAREAVSAGASARRRDRPPADTIVAAATPPGRGGIAIVRLSGPGVPAIAEVLLGATPSPRRATRASFANLDDGIALYFPAPHSYTGEHVLELHGHGGPVVVEALIARAVSLGARRAQAGEFTQRAYLNGKMDLVQAEAVADLIDAASQAAATAALRSLQGEFSQRVRLLGETLAALRVQVEAAIDFSEEELDALPETALRRQLDAAAQQLATLQASSAQGRLLTEGMTVVIAGAPNAGKSTLLNRLVGHDAAIVTSLPGTTRDVLRERMQIDGMPLQVLDTAGLRAQADDAIEAEGMRRAEAAMVHADRILFVLDAAADPEGLTYQAERARLPAHVPVTLVFNKIDLCADGASLVSAFRSAALPGVALSARTGEGMDTLREHLKSAAGFAQSGEGVISARARHLEALARCAGHLGTASALLEERRGRELIAEELRRASAALGEIIGTESPDELLGRIFASFCIGK